MPRRRMDSESTQAIICSLGMGSDSKDTREFTHKHPQKTQYAASDNSTGISYSPL